MNQYCFDDAAFEAESFNASNFLEECQSRNPIAQVHRDLEKFMQSLENQLVAIIDKDYAEFLQLSIKLKGVNSAALSLRSPLLQILERVQAVKAASYALVHKAEIQVEEFEDIQKQKEELRLAIGCVHHFIISEKLGAVETLLGIIVDPNPEDDNDDDDSGDLDTPVSFLLPAVDQSIQLERAARIVIELEYRIAQAQEIPAILAEEPRLVHIERALRQRLEAEFATEIVPDSFYAREHTMNISSVDHLLRTYVLLQEMSNPEEMIARLVVQPFLDETMTRARLDGKHRGSCEGLSAIYASVLQFVERKLGGILALPVCQGDDKNAVDLLGKSVWKPIHDTMRAKLTEVFTPANPDRFYHNYSTSMDFVTSLARFCTTPTARARFQLTTHDFQASWNVAVYFQLRQNELVQAIAATKDKRPADIFATDGGKHGGSFAFPLSTQTWQAALKCWTDGTFLPSLVASFARLTLGVVSDYVDYWRDPLAKALALAKAAAKTSFHELEHASLTSCDDVFCLGNDLHRLGGLMQYELVPAIAARVGAALLDEDATAFASQLIDEHCRALRMMEAQCWDAAVFLVAEECKKVLPAVRTIKGQYQMTNKPLPTTPSIYVPTIVRPVQDFIDKWGNCLDAPELSTLVLESTFDMYAALASDLLKSATELEESLRSRKNQRLSQALAEEGGNVSDTDKMRRQLYLDMDELARLATELGVNVTQFPSYTQMRQDVSPKEQH
ncbi:Aste57867_20112 [Aphanomyces stellatus]|uniref:Conserved oligomeric Golgi complex subunit 2 n=1 Tax=Aphanomyces stellatus TaxID=120398 RepID=A0A485LEC4_9STRA|nr:hypothetical protein As57867_020046 [Aphanomyces stellatus]VFT96807.1 Aste57867_20112 [Aphanomyces stellatus]